MPEYLQFQDGIVTGMSVKKWYSVDPSIVEGLPNILKIPRDEYKALTKWHKASGGQVVLMSQVEKDAILQAEEQAKIDAENTRIQNLDDLIESGKLQGITLIKVDNAIDNIGSLADAKVFLKKLCRYIIKFISRSM